MASTLGFVISKGLFAARPAAGVPGRLYYATDDTVLYRDNGTTWDELAVGSGYTDAELAAHVAAVDPHGDRAYADTTFIPLAQKAANNGVATLDATGKVPSDQLPGTALTDVFVVGSEAAMLALAADVGDIAIRTDTSSTYVLSATPASTLANWKQLLFPGGVSSVDGRTGAVTLDDLYDAAGAATSAVSTHNSATTSVHGLANTADVILEGDLRLTNPRTPTAHAASHELAGSDELAIAPSQLTQSGAATGEVLEWSGTEWAPAAAGDGMNYGPLERFLFGAQNAVATHPVTENVSASAALTSGQGLLIGFRPMRDLTISQMGVFVTSAGSGTTLFRIGLYTIDLSTTVDVSLVAATVSGTPALGMTTLALSTAGGFPATYTLTAGGHYGVMVLWTGTTGPAVARSVQSVVGTDYQSANRTRTLALGYGLGASTYGALTDLPAAPGAAAGVSTTRPWVRLD